jgi:hypothetical protein
MSSTASKFDQLSASGQAGKEVRINALMNSVSPSALGGRRESTTTGLTWGFYGGTILVNGVATDVASGTVTLTGSATNYVGISQAGVVSVATARNAGHAPLYTVVTTVGGVTSYTDDRTPESMARLSYGIASQALTAANVTLTQAQALCETLVVTGALTAVRDLVVPLVRRRWAVRHTGTGFDMRVIGATGTGITIGIGKAAIVECDGTNVNRLTADV